MLYPEGHGDELLADTDRATGIVRVHFAYDAFKRLLSTEFSSLTERDQISAAAISHEGMHVLQMMNTGLHMSCRCSAFSTLQGPGGITAETSTRFITTRISTQLNSNRSWTHS